MFCMFCGHELPVGAQYCERCCIPPKTVEAAKEASPVEKDSPLKAAAPAVEAVKEVTPVEKVSPFKAAAPAVEAVKEATPVEETAPVQAAAPEVKEEPVKKATRAKAKIVTEEAEDTAAFLRMDSVGKASPLGTLGSLDPVATSSFGADEAYFNNGSLGSEEKLSSGLGSSSGSGEVLPQRSERSNLYSRINAGGASAPSNTGLGGASPFKPVSSKEADPSPFKPAKKKASPASPAAPKQPFAQGPFKSIEPEEEFVEAPEPIIYPDGPFKPYTPKEGSIPKGSKQPFTQGPFKPLDS